jgi:hypothetical protein
MFSGGIGRIGAPRRALRFAAPQRGSRCGVGCVVVRGDNFCPQMLRRAPLSLLPVLYRCFPRGCLLIIVDGGWLRRRYVAAVGGMEGRCGVVRDAGWS